MSQENVPAMILLWWLLVIWKDFEEWFNLNLFPFLVIQYKNTNFVYLLILQHIPHF